VDAIYTIYKKFEYVFRGCRRDRYKTNEATAEKKVLKRISRSCWPNKEVCRAASLAKRPKIQIVENRLIEPWIHLLEREFQQYFSAPTHIQGLKQSDGFQTFRSCFNIYKHRTTLTLHSLNRICCAEGY
jgi:hypothetical protein